jgi:hypothetical protein
MKRVLAVSAALVLACACASAPKPAPATAAAKVPATQTAASGPNAPEEKKVCRTERVLGSVRPAKICQTKSESAAATSKGSDGVRETGRAISSHTVFLPLDALSFFDKTRAHKKQT